MARWLAVLLVFGIISGVLGFTTWFGNSVGMARTLFGIYFALAVVSLSVGILRR